ncbi:MAG: hypothetical protein FAZ92_01824 [Accumulibacter sp.]|nr:MAG: hypothetical protein FAZ92_01824 [Accumulibacter sp.]
MAGEGADLQPRLGIPEAQRPVAAAREQAAAIGRKGDAVDGAPVPLAQRGAQQRSGRTGQIRVLGARCGHPVESRITKFGDTTAARQPRSAQVGAGEISASQEGMHQLGADPPRGGRASAAEVGAGGVDLVEAGVLEHRSGEPRASHPARPEARASGRGTTQVRPLQVAAIPRAVGQVGAGEQCARQCQVGALAPGKFDVLRWPRQPFVLTGDALSRCRTLAAEPVAEQVDVAPRARWLFGVGEHGGAALPNENQAGWWRRGGEQVAKEAGEFAARPRAAQEVGECLRAGLAIRCGVQGLQQRAGMEELEEAAVREAVIAVGRARQEGGSAQFDVEDGRVVAAAQVAAPRDQRV